MKKRSLSGIKSTGTPHLGNYLGMIRPAIDLQDDFDSFYFVAEYHALTSERDPAAMRASTHMIAANFLAFGLDPARAAFFRQSDVPEVTELAWLLSCVTHMGLLERAHGYKAAKDQGKEKEINHGVFSYPVLMAADILIYDSDVVPIGRDQIQHLEMTRDIAVKLNLAFGENLVKLPEALVREEVAVVPGTDGRKMSKSYNNTISLREDEDSVAKKIRTMPTDPARVRRTDPGTPSICPVWQFHLVYSEEGRKEWVRQGCTSAGIGCLECKQPVIDAVLEEQKPMRERAQMYMDDPTLVRNIISDGCEKARELASETMRDVREAMGLNYG